MVEDVGAGERFTVTLRVPAPSPALEDAPAKLAAGLDGGGSDCDSSVKVRVAIGWLALGNWLLPRRLVITPWGEVFGLDKENPVPSSVPAS